MAPEFVAPAIIGEESVFFELLFQFFSFILFYLEPPE